MRIAGRITLLLAALAASLCLADALLRLLAPNSGFRSARELEQFRTSADVAGLFTVDPEFGFRPILDGKLYGPYGTLTNGYPLAKSPGRTRVLFVGDSVTARGRIVDALRAFYGDTGFEYWNAGVESFNTVQEVRYYERFNRAIHPDEVVLSFHMNDFETTPVAFVNAAGRLCVYAPNFPIGEMNPTLYRYSMLYRLWLGYALRGNRHIDAVIDETRRSLADLKAQLEQDHVRLSVVVLPLLKPYAEWSRGDQLSRAEIMSILESLGIRRFDLLDTLAQALRDGVQPCEAAGDDWHPSAAMAARFAQALHAQGLLAPPPGAP